MTDDRSNEIVEAETLAEVVHLRNLGYTFRAIGGIQGCSASTAYKRLQRAINKYYAPSQEAIKTLRGRSIAACETSLALAMRGIEEGDLDAVVPMLKILDKLQSLHGVEAWSAPTTAELSSDTARAAQNILATMLSEMDVVDAEIIEVIEEVESS